MINQLYVIAFFFFTFQIINIALSGEPTQKQKTPDNSISQPILQAALKPINDVTIKLLSDKVDLLIKDPEAYLKNHFKSTTQFKDLNSLKSNITKNASEIKKVKMSIEKDGLHLTYLNYALTISAHGIGNNPYMINNRPFSWDSQKDTFDALKENIKKLIVVTPQTTFEFSIISKAQAADEPATNDSTLIKAADILSSVIASVDVDRFIFLCNEGLVEKKLQFYTAIKKGEQILRMASEGCDTDLAEIKKQVKDATRGNFLEVIDTLGLISFLKSYNAALPITSDIMNCNAKDEQNHFNSTCIKTLKTICKDWYLLNACLSESKSLADNYVDSGKTINNYSANEKRYSFKPSNEEYKPLMEALTGEEVKSK